jgi:hypothetical protein
MSRSGPGVVLAIVGWMIVTMIAWSQSARADDAVWCKPDMNTLVRLEVLAKEQGSSGIMARSALKYLAQKELPTTGYFISKSPRATNERAVEYSLLHESGFTRPCNVAGNRSGRDGVLSVDPSTHEVIRFLFWQ